MKNYDIMKIKRKLITGSVTFLVVSLFDRIRKMSSTGIVVGLKKGYPVEKREVAPRPSHSKAVSLIYSIC